MTTTLLSGALPRPTLGLVFLDPSAGLTAGLLGGGAIIALYFLKLRRRPVRVSSTMLWERAVQDLQVNVPLRWLRPSWLLLLQLLGVAALAGALARPVVRGAWAPSGRVIIVIDRSASMGAADGARERTALGENPAPATRLDEAKRRADALIRRLDLASGASEAMVVVFAADARVVAPLTRSKAELLDAVAAITVTDQPGNATGAANLVRAFAQPPASEAGAEEDAPAVRASVVVFSDGALEPASDGADLLAGARLERCGPAPDPAPPANEPAETPAPSAALAPGRDNTSITACSARRDADNPSRARVFVRFQNSRPAPFEARAIVRVNGEAVRALTSALPGARPGVPGERAESVVVDAPGLSVIEISLDGQDLLGADDAAALALPAPGGPRVLVVAPAGETGAAEPDGALLHALESLEGARVRALTPGALDALTSSDSAIIDADLVVYDRTEPAGAVAKPSMHFAAGLRSLGVSVTDASEPDGARASRALAWSRTSPAMRDVSLDSLLVAGAPALDLPEGAQTLATGEGGALIASLESRATRRLFVAFDLARSTWWLSPGFAIFVANAAEWLTGMGAEAAARSLLTSEPAIVRPTPGAAAVRATGPSTVAARVPEPGPEPAPVSLGALERAGVYTVEGAAASDRVLAVNLLSAAESALETRDAPGVGVGAGRPGGAPEEGSREIWRWLAIAGALLLTLEWWLYAWRSRV